MSSMIPKGGLAVNSRSFHFDSLEMLSSHGLLAMIEDKYQWYLSKYQWYLFQYQWHLLKYQWYLLKWQWYLLKLRTICLLHLTDGNFPIFENDVSRMRILLSNVVSGEFI